MEAQNRGRDRLDVVDVDEKAGLPVAHDARCLPDARRDERDARGQRLEHALRPSLLTGGDHVRVEGVVRSRQLATTLRDGVAIRDPAPLELACGHSHGPAP